MKYNNIPKKGFAGLKDHFKDDLISGFSVSLIALPLCLGIAIASGVPPLAGLIAAIVGGLLASRIAGTFVTISGPAAGLIVITLGAVESMGYANALGAIVIGGGIMALFGLLKVGKVGDYFPSAAVHGMLAAIGVIIIIKQIFPAIGAASPKGEILEVASEIPHALLHNISPYAITIGLMSLAILIVHPMLKVKLIKAIPAPMWVLIFTIPTAMILGTENLKMVEMPHHLLGEGGFELPSFAKIGESAFWIAVTGFALVSAIETLLSAKAVDSLDPYKRNSNLNKDLVSMGIGSSLSAMIGGLPMISEIVRSSANVNSGAKTQWSNFFHGAFLLIFLLIGVVVIEMIPISALAAMLVFTGFRLASPKEFKHMFKIGLMEFEIFVVTLVAVLATDLIIGIAIGILFKYVLILFKGTKFKELFKSNSEIEHRENVEIIHLKGSQIFSNYLSLKKKMDAGVENTDELILDFSKVDFVDHTVMEHLEDYARLAKQKGKDVQIENADQMHPVSNHPLAARDRKTKIRLKDSNIEPRTFSLLSFAQTNGYEFQNRILNNGNWNFDQFSVGKKIVSIENIIRVREGAYCYEIADLKIQSGALLTEDIDQQTVLKISGLQELPKFHMQPTSFVDKIKTKLSYTDINFDSYPDFSKKYNLKSDGKEREVKGFFNNSLLGYFEEEQAVSLSSNGVDLLICFGEKLLPKEEISALIHFSNGLVELNK
jgi:MFS superfamily sulfate permease-like transporter